MASKALRLSCKAPTFEFETAKEPLELRSTRGEKMLDSEMKNGSATFSWADEVEKEEEEQARFKEQQKQKPNPFGSARPREEVLQEKGIDWTKYDIHLQQPSQIRQLDDLKLCKENIPAPAAPGIDRMHSVTPSKGLKHELEDANSELKRSEILRVPLASQNQTPVPYAPPLRYPPKNVIPSLSESGFHYYLHESGEGQQGFQNKRPLNPDKENAFHQQRSQRGNRLKNHGSHILPHHHRQKLQAEQGGQLKENCVNFKLGQSVGNAKNLMKSAASRIPHSDSVTERPCENLQEDYAVGHGIRQSLTNYSWHQTEEWPRKICCQEIKWQRIQFDAEQVRKRHGTRDR